LFTAKVSKPKQPSAWVTTLVESAVERPLLDLQAHPLARKLREGSIEKESYLALLRALLGMHRLAERAVAEVRPFVEEGFGSVDFRREAALIEDLRVLGGGLPVRSSEAIDRFDGVLRVWTRPPCASLLGMLWIFERERQRPIHLARPIGNALGVKLAPHSGLDYHLQGSDRASRRFQEFQTWLDAHVNEPARVDELRAGALRTVQTLLEIHVEVEKQSA
jgi:hypothetical protein